MKRRDFLSWVGVGALATSLPVALAACQSETASETTPDTTPNAVDSSPRPDGYAALAPLSDLETAGSITQQSLVGSPVIAIANPSTPQQVAAFNPMCTHQGCTVEWSADSQTFNCPCHGSQFNPDGSVATGPATEPLSVYEAKVEEGLVLVKVN